MTINSIDSTIPIAIAQGGSNASSFTTANGIVKYDTTKLVTSSTVITDGNYYLYNSSQPRFFAYLATSVSGVTGDTSYYTILFDTVVYDNTSSFSTVTGGFTAPKTGIYMFSSSVYNTVSNNAVLLDNIVAATSASVGLIWRHPSSSTVGALANSCIIQMTQGDVAYCQIVVGGDTSKSANIAGGTSMLTCFSGYLVC